MSEKGYDDALPKYHEPDSVPAETAVGRIEDVVWESSWPNTIDFYEGWMGLE